VTPDAVRLAPALVLTPGQADSFVAALPGILAAALAMPTMPTMPATPTKGA
jgi:acetylornithine/N-succinyldiaminopimelate aminotransferase